MTKIDLFIEEIENVESKYLELSIWAIAAIVTVLT